VPLGRRRRDDRQVAQSGHRHVQVRGWAWPSGSACRPRCAGLQPLLLADAEPVLLVDDHEPERLNVTSAFSSRCVPMTMSTSPAASAREDLGDLLGERKRDRLLDAHRPIGEAVGEVLIVLLASSVVVRARRPAGPPWPPRRRRASRPRSCRSRRRRRPPGPSAAPGPCRRARVDRRLLVRRLLEGKAGRRQRSPRPAGEGKALARPRAGRRGRAAPRRRREPVRPHGAGCAPTGRPEPVPAERPPRRHGVAADQVQRGDGTIELVAPSYSRARNSPAGRRPPGSAGRGTGHAVLLVHHRRADVQLRELRMTGPESVAHACVVAAG